MSGYENMNSWAMEMNREVMFIRRESIGRSAPSASLFQLLQSKDTQV